MRIDITNTPIEYLVERCLIKSNEEQSSYKEKICCGNLKDFEEYKHYCGVIKGLAKADDIIKTVYRSLFEVVEKEIKNRESYVN